MKLKYMLSLLLAFLMSCAGSDVEEFVPPTPGEPEEPEEEVVFHKEASELYSLIKQCYGIRNGATAGLFNENYPKQSSDNSASYLWPYDGLVTGAAALYRLGYTEGYVDLVDNFEVYYAENSNASAVGGYSSTTNGTCGGGGTRFYDDNSIVGLDLVEAYQLTKDSKYLTRAKRIVDFLKSGEDDIHGGGLWWNEDEKNIIGNANSNKPTCANGYATNFLLKYHSVCPSNEKKDVLEFAKRLYHWLNENLRDADGTFFNDRQADGAIRKDKWTYNTGVMISNALLLYKITGEQGYLDSAIASAEGGYSYFVRPVGDLALAYPNHDPWFTIKLVNAFIEIEPYYPNVKQYVETFINFTKHALKNARTSNGLFREDWTGVNSNSARDRTLLMQDAALESLAIIALYKGEKNTK